MPRKSSWSPSTPLVPRPCALVRVSSEEQVDQFSLPMQVHKVDEYCRQQLGVELPESAIFREEGVSGRPGTLKKRPGLSAAIDACLAGRYTHLIVHKLDRLGRNVGLVSSVLERLDQHGIVFVSVQDRVDASTAAGRLYIAIFIAIAQWYSDNLSEETRKGKEGRRRAGLYNGILPFGATRGEGPQAAPLPDLRQLDLIGSDGIARRLTNHAGLLQAFTWCGQGYSAREIAIKLNELGYRTHGTWGINPFTKDTVQHLLGNRFYLGELPDGNGGWVPGKHGALIPEELWEQAQRARARQRRNPQTIPGHARVHVLGEVSCGAGSAGCRAARPRSTSPRVARRRIRPTTPAMAASRAIPAPSPRSLIEGWKTSSTASSPPSSCRRLNSNAYSTYMQKNASGRCPSCSKG
jgi:DNA invertase Pin-like site-specific DNA recombinase